MSDLTHDELVDLIGTVGAGEFENSPDYAKPELTEWIRKLRDLSDKELFAESRHWVYEGALVQRFRTNFDHIHCKGTACFHESRRRLMLAGHDKGCAGPSIYSRAHATVMRDNNYTPSPEGTCACEEVASSFSPQGVKR